MTRLEWAERFKENPKCGKCPFVGNIERTGDGDILHCDGVCQMEAYEIVEEIKRMEETA